MKVRLFEALVQNVCSLVVLVVSLRRPVEGVVRRLEGDHQEQRPAGVTTLDGLHRLLGEHLCGEQACRGQNTLYICSLEYCLHLHNHV